MLNNPTMARCCNMQPCEMPEFCAQTGVRASAGLHGEAPLYSQHDLCAAMVVRFLIRAGMHDGFDCRMEDIREAVEATYSWSLNSRFVWLCVDERGVRLMTMPNTPVSLDLAELYSDVGALLAKASHK